MPKASLEFRAIFLIFDLQTPAVAILSSLALVVNFAFFRLSKQYNLFNKNIQIKPLLDVSEIEEGFITILIPIGDLNANESFMSLGVQIDIYLPVNSWMINEENLRPYLIMDEIVKKINLKRITSIGTLVFSGFELDTVSDKVTRHSMTFMVDSQNGK